MNPNKTFYSNKPRLVENQILEYIPKDHLIQIQASGDYYMRLKSTPSFTEEFIKNLEEKFRVKTKKYLSDDSCIIEIKPPQFDIIIIRDTSKFPKLNGWILRVVRLLPWSEEMDVIATFDYNEDHPYNLTIAEKLLSYLTSHVDELDSIEYEEIYTI